MRVLMLVATSVATDTRVLREATTLVDDGHEVHVIGKSVPTDYVPPPGVTVSSVGTSSVFRAEGGASIASRDLPAHLRLARWVLLPQHRNSAFGRWAKGAVADGRARDYDVVHAHDFTALEAGAALADHRGVPLVYDSHELWSGRPRQYRPTPLHDWRERRTEARLGSRAAAVITVGEGVADVLRRRNGWRHVTVVRNTFQSVAGGPPPQPTGAVYAGRLAPFRELEVIARASVSSPLPITLIGPSDPAWLAGFDPGTATVREAVDVDTVTVMLQEAGIALVTHGDNFDNLRLALPNKAFQAVAAGIPVVATDVGELGALVREYGLGELYPPGDSAALGVAIESVVRDYPRWCAQVADARAALAWDVDAAVLRELYRGLS
jgi:glycosyltransferase involved in cell wall biosynthesis